LFQGNLVLEHDKRVDLISKLERMGLDPEPNGGHKGAQVRQRTKGKNEGKDVFYYVINSVDGLLSDITLRETDFGEFLSVEFTDVDEVYVVSLGDVFGRFAKDFIRRIESVDLASEVVFGTWVMEADNGKTYSGVRLYQVGEKIEYVYANEDLPPPIEKTRGGKTSWDFSDQEEFLYDLLIGYLKNNFKPVVGASSSEKKEEPEVLPPSEQVESQEAAKKKPVKKEAAKEPVGAKDKKKTPADSGKDGAKELPWAKEDVNDDLPF
tara:strand:+ start:7400 stop:8194 length:795 start_codon:yes stop_codon:yes gene_type:complete